MLKSMPMATPMHAHAHAYVICPCTCGSCFAVKRNNHKEILKSLGNHAHVDASGHAYAHAHAHVVHALLSREIIIKKSIEIIRESCPCRCFWPRLCPCLCTCHAHEHVGHVHAHLATAKERMRKSIGFIRTS